MLSMPTLRCNTVRVRVRFVCVPVVVATASACLASSCRGVSRGCTPSAACACALRAQRAAGGAARAAAVARCC